MKNKYEVYYFSGTHWDREWYQTFQEFRMRLVDTMDHLIDYLERHPEFGVFHLDGQTIALEDYIEVRPEKRERLESLIRAGRVVIGPWYCMPDENLVSGEALIRNLTLGMSLSRQWGGEPWKVGYLCDTFGHIAQMPQILCGMGIPYAVLGRGTNQYDTPPFFQWLGPDGSHILTYKVPDRSGYGSFSMDVVGQRVREEITPPYSKEFAEGAAAYIEAEKARANVPVLVVLDAMDHEPLHEETIDYLHVLRRMYPEDRFHHTNLVHAFQAVEASEENLPMKKGELNKTAKEKGLHLHVLSHVLSSRYKCKRRNDYVESLLEHWMEPMMVMLSNMGLSYPEAYRSIAWKSLLQNHPHDTICGCSIDLVHRDMDFRFAQTENICHALLQDAEYRLAGGRHLLTGKQTEYISLINPLPYEISDIVEITVPFEREYPKWSEPFGYEDICAFRLYSSRGEEIPYTIREIRPNSVVRTVGEKTVAADLYRLVFHMKGMMPGITSLRVEPSDWPVRFLGGMVQDHTMENDHVQVTVQSDGRLTLVDKKTGKTYINLLGVCDDGEIGDGWNSVRPVSDRCITSDRVESVAITATGPVYSEIEVRRVMQIPIRREGNRRSDVEDELRCTFTIGLGCEDRYVDIRMTVDNKSRDHRLRLMIPTGLDTDTYEASQAFTFVQRKVGIDEATHDWKEKAALEKAMDGILGLRDVQGNGLAFMSDFGIHEGGVARDANRTVYITLLRCFSKTCTTNGEIDGQELGKSEYRFRLRILDSMVTPDVLMREQAGMRTGVYAFVTRERLSASYLRMEGNACISAIKPAEDGSGDEIIRLYNPTEKTVTVLLHADRMGNWKNCDLLEHVTESGTEGLRSSATTETNASPFFVTLEAGKIQTIRFEKF